MTRHAQTPPERERGSDPPIRLKGWGFEVAAKGASAIYAAALFGCFVVGARILPPVVDAARELSTAMQASADTLRKVAADAADARAGVGRVEAAQQRVDERLGRIEGDIAALRADIRGACQGRK